MQEQSLVRAGIIGFVALIFLSSTFFVVQENEQALVLQFGEIKRTVRKPGLRMKMPFVQDLVYFDKRLLDFHAEPRELITGDSERVMVDAYARYRITDPAKFFVSVRNEETMNSRLSNILESSLRQEIASARLKTVLSEDRAKLMNKIRDEVNELVKGNEKGKGGFGIEVVDVRIMRTDLPQENSEAVFNRMRTEREREAREFRAQGQEEALKIRAEADRTRTVMLAEAKQKSETLRGEGDGLAAKIYNDAMGRDPQFFAFWRSMQAYRVTLGNEDTSMVLSPDSGFLEYLKKAP